MAAAARPNERATVRPTLSSRIPRWKWSTPGVKQVPSEAVAAGSTTHSFAGNSYHVGHYESAWNALDGLDDRHKLAKTLEQRARGVDVDAIDGRCATA
jgi:hypothetical protein